MSENTAMEVDNLVVTDPKPPVDIEEKPDVNEAIPETVQQEEHKVQNEVPEVKEVVSETVEQTTEQKPELTAVESTETAPTAEAVTEIEVKTKDDTVAESIEVDSSQVATETTEKISEEVSETVTDATNSEVVTDAVQSEQVSEKVQLSEAPVSEPVSSSTAETEPENNNETSQKTSVETAPETVGEISPETNNQPSVTPTEKKSDTEQVPEVNEQLETQQPPQVENAKSLIESVGQQLAEGFRMDVDQTMNDLQQQEVKEEPKEDGLGSGEAPEMEMFSPNMEMESTNGELNSFMESDVVYGVHPSDKNIVYQESQTKSQTSLSQGLKIAAASKGVYKQPENIILPTKKKVVDQSAEQEEAVVDHEMLRNNFCEITKMLGDGYVQYCCKSDGSTYPSNFALYFNDHLIDMYTLARKGGNLWHISRMTLCPGVHLTTISYQNPKVLKKSKCVRPIFMGPILIHTCVSEQVYREFFYKLKDDFTEIQAQFEDEGPVDKNFLWLTDVDEDLVYALDSVFTHSMRVFCHWTVPRLLKSLEFESIEYCIKQMMQVNTKKEFYRMREAIKKMWDYQDSDDKVGIENMIDLVFNHVCLPRWKFNWEKMANNNLSRVAKHSMNLFFSKQLPGPHKFVQQVRIYVEGQFLDMKKVFTGSGDFSLLGLPVTRNKQRTEDEVERLYLKLLQGEYEYPIPHKRYRNDKKNLNKSPSAGSGRKRRAVDEDYDVPVDK